MHRSFYDRTRRQVRDLSSGPFRILLDIEVRRIQCRQCCAVKRERLSFLADNPFYTQRFAYYVGRRCRSATIKDIAEELRLDWDAVKELDKQYMRAQLKRAGTPGPRAIGIDEISIRKGHTYRIVVSDLIRHRPIWFGGEDRSEASMDEFYRFLGDKKAPGQATHVHQGSEIHFVGAPAESHRQRQEESQTAAGGQQAPQYRLRVEGILRPALGLQQLGVGPEVLRQLAGAAQMATPETLRGLC